MKKNVDKESSTTSINFEQGNGPNKLKLVIEPNRYTNEFIYFNNSVMDKGEKHKSLHSFDSLITPNDPYGMQISKHLISPI